VNPGRLRRVTLAAHSLSAARFRSSLVTAGAVRPGGPKVRPWKLRRESCNNLAEGSGQRLGRVSVDVVSDATGGGASRWKTFGERVIYDNPWVWLGQVDVELPDGERFWHHVVRLHRAAMMVLVDDQDRVLLLWRHRFVQDRWGWELPGGLIDEGEEPAETAVRELEEETGYRAGRVEHLITFQPMVGMVDSEHVVFVGRDPVKAGEPTETTEIERMEWVPLASVPGLITAGEIWNSGTLVALLRLLIPQG
jgi:8-oxo-dGDP phosphatase